MLLVLLYDDYVKILLLSCFKFLFQQTEYLTHGLHFVLGIYSHFNANKNPTDATVCRYLFTAKLLYMFRVSPHPLSVVLKTVTAASGTGHNTGAATSLQRGLIKPRWREVAVPVL